MKNDKKKNKTRLTQPGENDIKNQTAIDAEKNTFPGYAIYPSGDESYNKDVKETVSGKSSKIKEPDYKSGIRNDKFKNADITDNDPYMTGAELNDEQENNESEYEKNNDYSMVDDNYLYEHQAD
jgi:hypothetical protein